MTKQEFLRLLQRELNEKAGWERAAEHVEFYQEYIEIQVRKGRSEEEAIKELGDPRLLVRSIVSASKKEKRKAGGPDSILTFGRKLKESCAHLYTEVTDRAREWFRRL